ncbi:MAG: vitamin B12-dependent ribonucleotide reductase [Clostridiales bacterium]|jgi:ribonucleoside-diphosphate reductase alpha chain|nr:vitamin B12-dependent ribonucleotide reductase [Clostridiales bacterium]
MAQLVNFIAKEERIGDGMKVDRFFARGALEAIANAIDGFSQAVYDLFEWKTSDVVLKDYATGASIANMQGLEFPVHYSQNAVDIIATKYFVKEVRDEGGKVIFPGETSMRQVVHRMVSFWVLSMLDMKLILASDKQTMYDELAYMMLDQRFAPNSPQFFNTGLFHSYGIKGSKNGHFYYDPEKGKVLAASNSYQRTQGSACFILGVEDALLGPKSLMDNLSTETLLFKYGSGVGSNWSNIRAKGEYLSGGGKSSGLLSFLKVSDRNAGAIKSGGTTRRAAKMNILDLDHPEVMDYINWKSREEDKVSALGKMGYDAGFDGEAYDTVSGQNANNSVRVPDDFMRLLGQEGAMWQTKGRVTDAVNGEIPVNDIWEAIAQCAWRCGDPGVQYDDVINAWHTCPAGEDGKAGAKHNRINGSNPCSEYLFLDDTACNLASINILRFYNAKSETFDVEGYCHAIKLIQMVLEATIHWGAFPTADIARKSHKFRTTGIGLTNLGALFMYMGLPYDSDRARNLGAALCSIMTGKSYHTSAQMAEKVGAFECYEQNAPHMMRVIRNHAAAASVGGPGTGFEDMPYTPVCISHEDLRAIGMGNLSDCLSETWEAAIEQGKAHGYRNAQVSVLAPTGTIAFAMDCDSTSAEPFFSHIAFKKLVGGGSMVVENRAIRHGLAKLGYDEKQIEEIIEYIMRTDANGNIIDGKIEGAPHISHRPAHLRVFDTANRCGSGERFLSPESHVKMLASLTPHVTGAISKTVNLPRQATVEYIKDIYQLSWELGVKAVALYRDGSKETQPLSTTEVRGGKLRPRGIRKARVHEAVFTEFGTRIYVITSFYGPEDGELAGKLAEVFIVSGRQGSITKGLLETIGIGISKSLQHGIPAEEISKMYAGQIYEPNGLVQGHPFVRSATSISDLVSQIITKEARGYDIASLKPTPPSTKNGAGKRKKPSGIRHAEVHEAKIGTNAVFVVASFYGEKDLKDLGEAADTKRLCEIFAFCGEQGTTVKGMLGSLSTTISISLQSGVPAESIARINRRQSYDPSGLVSGHPYIGSVSSVSDLISKVIDISYGNYDNCQIKPGAAGDAPKHIAPESLTYTAADILYGENCAGCGSDKMVQSGICKVCINCGTTTGCS